MIDYCGIYCEDCAVNEFYVGGLLIIITPRTVTHRFVIVHVVMSLSVLGEWVCGPKKWLNHGFHAPPQVVLGLWCWVSSGLRYAVLKIYIYTVD